MNTIQGIKGFLGTSLIDYPGKVAAVVFLAGCNMRCPYCHNQLLLDRNSELQDLSVDELIDALNRRRKLLDAVVVTGGEPTYHPQLTHLLRHLRMTELEIKLDTNGLRTNILAAVLGEGLVDYVAIDVKMAPERYPAELKTLKDAAQRLTATVELVKASDVDYEFRTTCVPGMVREEDIRLISQMIKGAPAYYLQQYIPTHCNDPELSGRPPYPREVLERFKTIAEPYVNHVGLRNI